MNRTDEPTEIVKVGVGAAQIDWLAEYAGEEDKSTEGMDEYRVLPRIKMIQGMTKESLKDEFGEGAAVLIPGPALVCPKDGAFTFVPVVFWTEFWRMSDLDDKDAPMILKKETDKTGLLAQSCRDKTGERRSFFYKKVKDEYEEVDKPDGWKEAGDDATYQGRNCEVLIFAIIITTIGHPMMGMPCTYAFLKGEFRVGRAFTNQIGMRKIMKAGKPEDAPLWSTHWEAKPNLRNEGPKKKWYGLDMSNAESPYIDASDAPFYKAQHESLKDLLRKNSLGSDTSDMDDVGGTKPTSPDSKF